MFGHGQVEGFSEKYGMEFRRPKWDETRDDGLVRGHDWRIFPLLHRRYLFADVEQFLLYDFYRPSGGVDEEVFAYSNRFNEERGLVIYHNKFADTKGWIKTSAAYIDKSSGKTKRRNLAEGLACLVWDMSSSKIMSLILNTSAPAKKSGIKACTWNLAPINATPSWTSASWVILNGKPSAIN
jgi:hypothetical protein